MHKLLRILLLWLLALAVPMQGFAAATMFFCAGANHEQQTVRQHCEHEHANGAAQGDLGGLHHEHEHSDPVVQPDTHSHSSSVHEIAGKCNTCSTCCAAMAMLPVPIIQFKAVRGGATLFAIEPQADVAFLTGGPDRPPRTILA